MNIHFHCSVSWDNRATWYLPGGQQAEESQLCYSGLAQSNQLFLKLHLFFQVMHSAMSTLSAEVAAAPGNVAEKEFKTSCYIFFFLVCNVSSSCLHSLFVIYCCSFSHLHHEMNSWIESQSGFFQSRILMVLHSVAELYPVLMGFNGCLFPEISHIK